jgi:hypothetical protein
LPSINCDHILDGLLTLSYRLEKLETKIDALYVEQENRISLAKLVDSIFNSESESSHINLIHDKLDCLISDELRVQRVEIAQKTLDRFEDYMKNVDKINNMINEFKGCVSMARASLNEGRKGSAEFDILVNIDKILKKNDEMLHNLTKTIKDIVKKVIEAVDRLDQGEAEY